MSAQVARDREYRMIVTDQPDIGPDGMLVAVPRERWVAIVADGDAIRKLATTKQYGPGVSWGYHGSGPAGLALAMLVDALDLNADDEWIIHDVIGAHFQSFKDDVIARHDKDHGWAMARREITEWLKKHAPDVLARRIAPRHNGVPTGNKDLCRGRILDPQDEWNLTGKRACAECFDEVPAS